MTFPLCHWSDFNEHMLEHCKSATSTGSYYKLPDPWLLQKCHKCNQLNFFPNIISWTIIAHSTEFLDSNEQRFNISNKKAFQLKANCPLVNRYGLGGPNVVGRIEAWPACSYWIMIISKSSLNLKYKIWYEWSHTFLCIFMKTSCLKPVTH